MKIKRLILSLLACAALVTACEEQEEDSLIPSIEITASEMNIGEPGDVQTVSITSNRHWEVTTDANWIAVEPESGEASSAPVSVTVTILENTGYDRTAAVKFNAGNDGKYFDYKTLTVTQTGPKGAPSGDDGTQGTVDDPYSVGKAIYILNNGTYTSDKVYVKGIISRIDEVDTGFGNATYFISDDGGNTIQLEVYRGNYLGGAKFTSADQIKVGDEVIVYGVLTIYKGTLEFTQGSEIYSLNGEGGETPGDYAYSIDFTQSQKGWTIKDINKPDGVDFIWAPDTKYGYKATGFVNQVRYKTESYIVSPALVIEEGEPGIAYSAAANFFNGKVDQLCGVLVREVTPDGAGEWVRLEGAGFTENGWNFSDQTASLADYAGKTVQVAFRYTSDGTDTGTGTLEVKNFKANATVDESLTPDDPEPEPEPEVTYAYEIDFMSTQEGWRIKDVEKPAGIDYIWTTSTSYGYIASGYANQQRFVTDSYIISPVLDIDSATPGIAYSAAANFFNGAVNELCGVYVREVTPNGAQEWNKLSAATFTENKWTFTDETASIASYAGKSVQIAFRYTSGGTNTDTGTLEVKYFKASGTVNPNLDPGDDETPDDPGDDTSYVYDYTINFTESQEKWTIADYGQTAGMNVWTIDSRYGYKATAYIDGYRYISETYLVSPALFISPDFPGLFYDEATNFFKGKTDEMCGVYVREITPTGPQEWSRLTEATFSSEDNWDFTEHEVSLEEYAGKIVQIGFHYASDGTDTGTGTLEIKNFKVSGHVDTSYDPSDDPTGGDDDPSGADEFAPGTYTFDCSAGTTSGDTRAGKQTVTYKGITLNVSYGILGTDDGQYRIYKNETLTISVPEGHHITAVQFECTAEGTSKYGPGCFSEMDGYSYQGAYGSWEGYISSLTFTAEHNQVRATKIEVTVE